MSAVVLGPVDWNLSVNDDGHREYTIKWKVQTLNGLFGPYTVMKASGLPQIGDPWNIGEDYDPWAFCLPRCRITRQQNNEEIGNLWYIEQYFATRPIKRCQDASIENPLLEPPLVSGSFVRFTREIAQDRHGKPIRTSSQEVIKGAMVEFDDNRPTVRITMNFPELPLDTFSEMMDTVNDAELWGCPKRCVKLSSLTWDRAVFGMCNVFFPITLEFDINMNTFDRKIPDQGVRVLQGHCPGSLTKNNPLDPDAIDATTTKANYLNPQNYELYKDAAGDHPGPVLLDGKGRPLPDADDPVDIDIEHYAESNFLELGIPTNLATASAESDD